MRLVVLGDTHFGVRGDSLHFHNYFEKFYREVFFPYLDAHNIKTVIQTGDLFDRRKFVSYNTLFLSKKYFFEECKKRGITLYVYIGNHDIYYRNTTEVNSIELTLKEYIDDGSVICFTDPSTINEDGCDIDIIPWICQDNESKILDFIKNSKSQICFGHFELTGFEMDRGNVCHDGMSREILSKYDMVISGHFHHRSTDGQIYYVGTPTELTWADYDDKRGFHVFDTKTRELDFVENPNRMFHKIIYDDKAETLESIANKNYEEYRSVYVKVIVANKSNPILYDMFLDNLYKVSPIDITVVEDFTDYSEISDDDIVDQSDDTLTILDKFIDGLEMDSDKNKLKSIMRKIYLEAQNIETK